MKLCYKLFQEAHLKTWQQILTKFKELEIAMNEGGKTMGHRQSLFFRLAENHCHVVCQSQMMHCMLLTPA